MVSGAQGASCKALFRSFNDWPNFILDIVDMSLPLKGEDCTGQIVTGLGRKYQHYDTDFSDRASLYRSIEAVKQDWATIDILFNNAALIGDHW